jgi:hypothetical protein
MQIRISDFCHGVSALELKRFSIGIKIRTDVNRSGLVIVCHVGPLVPAPPPQQGRRQPTGSECLGDKAGIVGIFRSLLRLEFWLAPWIRGNTAHINIVSDWFEVKQLINPQFLSSPPSPQPGSRRLEHRGP